MGLVHTIISGGQTGADRAALEFALATGIAVRGWVPCGRLAEDGAIPARYAGLAETPSDDPAERTRCNVRDSDGAVIFTHGPPTGGTALAAAEAERLRRPCLHVDFQHTSLACAAAALRSWLHRYRIHALNVAGPRASEDPAIFGKVIVTLTLALLTGAAK